MMETTDPDLALASTIEQMPRTRDRLPGDGTSDRIKSNRRLDWFSTRDWTGFPQPVQSQSRLDRLRKTGPIDNDHDHTRDPPPRPRRLFCVG
jgi:hypothetical protein